MNIAILNFHSLGGSGIIAYEIAKAMEKRGHNIHFVGLKPPLRYENDGSCFTFHRISMQLYPVFDFQPYTLALASQLSELIVKCDIQVIHSHYAIPHSMAALMARQISGQKVNCITTLHGTDITVVGSHPSMYNITKYSIENSDHVTAVSDYLNEKTTKNFSLKKDKISTIYNFINEDEIDQNSFQAKKINPEKVLLIHSSNLREIKAPLELIEIFAKILKSNEKVSNKKVSYHLGILGEGPLKKKMQELAAQLGVLSSITFYGKKLYFSDIYSSASFFLLPSYDESFGLAALEAMAYGIPVFARKTGGIPEVITDGEEGFLFCTDHGKIVEKINYLVDNPEEYEKISRNAFNKVKNHFSHKKIIDQYDALYKDYKF